jgi:hypothetical protein
MCCGRSLILDDPASVRQTGELGLVEAFVAQPAIGSSSVVDVHNTRRLCRVSVVIECSLCQVFFATFSKPLARYGDLQNCPVPAAALLGS